MKIQNSKTKSQINPKTQISKGGSNLLGFEFWSFSGICDLKSGI
jgi:hypothetical protein